MEYINSPVFLIAITFVTYLSAKKLQSVTGWIILNPVLVTIASLIAFLKISGVSYENYYEGGRMIEFWLKPAIVALGVPLYGELHHRNHLRHSHCTGPGSKPRNHCLARA